MGELQSLGHPEVLYLGREEGKPFEVQDCTDRIRLVRRDSPLLSFSDDDDEHDYLLIPGENVTFSESEKILRAERAGYPSFVVTSDDTACRITASVTPFVTLSRGNMFATMTLHPEYDGRCPDTAELQTILEEEGVLAGIDSQALARAVSLCSEGLSAEEVLVARGCPPLHGKDAWFRFEVEIGPTAGTVLRSGKIDFRERKVFTAVEAGQLLATKVAFTEGTPGQNVLGETIAQKPGRDIKVLVSGDAELIPETNEVRAKCSGLLSVANGTSIKVQSKQVISGDVDYETGNIESGDSVEISGTVKPGFTVTTQGDVLIGGNIQHASVVSKANAIIKGGLVGEKGFIRARGDVDIAFVERAKIQAGGTVLVRRQAYYSTIRADGSIHCTEESAIMGGELICAKSGSVGTIGSTNAGDAFLAAGVDPTRFAVWQDLREQRDFLDEKLRVLLQHKGEEAARELPKFNRLEKEYNELRKRLASFNLIPGTPENSLHEPLMNICDAVLDVYGSVAVGTLVRIGNVEISLPQKMEAVTFWLNSATGEIETKPLEKKA